tara:strand:+ start:193 stop:669 length:477 start_codon:yes stop_codon:yes gene_type:complete
MSRVVRGLGPEPDIRAARIKYKNDPKGMRNFRRRLSSFRRAEKFQNLINRLRGRNPKKGTPRADRIAERIKRLEQRKDRNLERSRLPKREPDKMSGSRDRGRKSTVTDDSGMGPKRKRPMPKPISRRFAPGEGKGRPMPKPTSRRRLEDEKRRVPRRG